MSKAQEETSFLSLRACITQLHDGDRGMRVIFEDDFLILALYSCYFKKKLKPSVCIVRRPHETDMVLYLILHQISACEQFAQIDSVL